MSTPQQPPLTKWDRALELYTIGGDDVEVAKELGITMPKFHQLYAEEPAFATFVDKGRALYTAWWHSQGRLNLFSKEFNTGLWNFNMKNRFGWADKIESNSKVMEENTSVDALNTQVGDALKRLGAKNPHLLRMLNGDKDA